MPSGVFVLCRILLKERLDLHNNQLQSLNGGGALNDLSNLTQINLSFNRFTRVPDEFCNTLKNLRVSFTRCFFFFCSTGPSRVSSITDRASGNLRIGAP